MTCISFLIMFVLSLCFVKLIFLFFVLFFVLNPLESNEVLNSLLRYRTSAELDSNHMNAHRPDYTLSQSSHLKSISLSLNLITKQTSEPTECFASHPIEELAIFSNEDCNAIRPYTILPNHSLPCLDIKASQEKEHTSTDLVLPQVIPLNPSKCKELIPPDSHKSIEANCHLDTNSFTNKESIALHTETITPTRRISTPQIRELKRYCLCCII